MEKNLSPHEEVQKRYEKFADVVIESGEPLPFNVDGSAPKTGGASERLAERIYDAADLIDLPTPAVNASIGCGNPTAFGMMQAGETVLDLGSGGGIDCFLAAKQVGSIGKVFGVDATPSMIELANRNKAQMGVTNVEFRLGQIEALPVESESIDLIISNCVIDISADKTAVFQEAHRVLKSGGRIAISDTVIMGEIPPKVKKNVDVWAGAVITPLISLNAYLQFMIDAGFVEIEVKSLTSYGLEAFDQLDAESQKMLTQGVEWQPLPPNTGLYSAIIVAQKG